MLTKILVNIYKGIMYSRHDIDDTVFYFSASDFSGLSSKPFNFKTKRGHTIKGWFYSYEYADTDRIIVFDHGLAVGHRSYMREIETLAKHGYLVYTFDHTGCTLSEGEHIYGFAGSLYDLDEAISSLKENPQTKGKRISVIGHSRGGYSTLNIPAYHPEIEHIVAISGFSEVRDIQEQLVPKFLTKTRRAVYELEKKDNPYHVDATAVNNLKNTKTKALIIHSVDDKTVSVKHFEKLRSNLEGEPNIRFILVDEKIHNPHYTADAVSYKEEYFKKYKRLKKSKKTKAEDFEALKKSYDWKRMTAQDEAVWQEIFNHLDS